MNLTAILECCNKFVRRIRFPSKKLKRVLYFDPWSEQQSILDTLLTGKDTLILKPRQIGSTTVVCMYLFWKIYTSKVPITVAIISHKEKSAKEILNKYYEFYDGLPKKLRRRLSVRNTTHMKFEDTKAEVICISARADGGLRSFSCNYAHITEYAFQEGAEELLATASGALNGGQLIIESTANYMGDPLYREIEKNEEDQSYEFLFFPWTQHIHYRKPLSRICPEWTGIEFKLMDQGLEPEQILWRRHQIQRLGLTKFKREYPLTIEEAFSAGEGQLFDQELIETLQTIPLQVGRVVTLSQPRANTTYFAGADIASGRGKDYSALIILDSRGNLCAYYYGNKIAPGEFWDIVNLTCGRYAITGKLKLLYEKNNHGEVFYEKFEKLNTHWAIPFLTTQKSKPVLIETLRAYLNKHKPLTVLEALKTELPAWQLNKNHIPCYPRGATGHGDTTIAYALATKAYNDY